MTPSEFRDGLTLLTAVQFGDACARMMRRFLKIDDSSDRSYDMHSSELNSRGEVKFAVAKPKQVSRLDTEFENVVDWIERAKVERKFVSFAVWRHEDFSCSFSQIKPFAFDILYYGICFFDGIKIFKILSDEIDERIHYSDSQYRCGSFHVTTSNLGYHLAHHSFASLTYADMMELTKGLVPTGPLLRRRRRRSKETQSFFPV